MFKTIILILRVQALDSDFTHDIYNNNVPNNLWKNNSHKISWNHANYLMKKRPEGVI